LADENDFPHYFAGGFLANTDEARFFMAAAVHR